MKYCNIIKKLEVFHIFSGNFHVKIMFLVEHVFSFE